MRSGTLCLLALTAMVYSLIPFTAAEAFCVYNKSDQEISVIQESGGKDCWGFCPWQANIKPGDHACCNWKDGKCNKEGKKDSIVTFSLPQLYEDAAYYCKSVKVRAGGWLTIKGKDNDITCHAHD